MFSKDLQVIIAIFINLTLIPFAVGGAINISNIVNEYNISTFLILITPIICSIISFVRIFIMKKNPNFIDFLLLGIALWLLGFLMRLGFISRKHSLLF